ncbi:LmeA family phospholipid-binding protein [Microbacterium sp. ARD32]|uniref:LmeA family phospholipid-binding protein n=1 Tax=Microbacterium sp. ARD32 TaxID=2962577 RepID=UPI002881A84B|nr:LmeA family phospholipid-binding protein [Microbacterium sp. ARD32]MDT0156855.1 LmeA family phospholipid-binding protein [Microbacterium sp. ARD32]
MTTPASGADAGRRRARWPWMLLIAVVVVAVLLVAAELVARAVVPGLVRSAVVQELNLPADQQLDVETSGILLPQLISGTLHELQLSSEKVTIGGITGAAHVTAGGVPIRGGALDSAQGTVAIDQHQFAALLKTSQLPITKVELDAPDATVRGDIPLFGREVPVGLTVTPGAQDGDLLLTPVSAELGGSSVDLQELARLFGGLGERLAAPQRVCIADRLPEGVTLTGLRVERDRAVARFRVDGRIGVDPALRENGTCPR